MALTSHTAARVLFVAAVLAAGTAAVVASFGAVRGGPFVPVLFIVLMELGIAGVALLLRAQLLRQHPPDVPPDSPSDV